MKPATASADNGTFLVPNTTFRPEGISIRFRPADTWLNSPFAPEQSPLSALSRRSFMKNAELAAYFMKPATARADNGAFSVPNTSFRPEGISIRFSPAKYFVEFALRARTITTPGALATQFHEKCGLNKSKRAPNSRTDPRAIEK
jgi:hypothetical protein